MPMQFCEVCQREEVFFAVTKSCTGHSDWTGPVSAKIRAGRRHATVNGGRLRDYKTPGFIVGRLAEHQRPEREDEHVHALASALSVRNVKTFQSAQSDAIGPRRTPVQVAVAHKIEKARLETVAYTAKRERLEPADAPDTYDPLAGFHSKTRKAFKMNRALNAFDGRI